MRYIIVLSSIQILMRFANTGVMCVYQRPASQKKKLDTLSAPQVLQWC